MAIASYSSSPAACQFSHTTAAASSSSPDIIEIAPRDSFQSTITQIEQLLKDFSIEESSQTKHNIFKKIRILLSTLMTAPSNLSQAARDLKIEKILDETTHTFFTSIITGKETHDEFCTLSVQVIKWMKAVQRKELPEFMTILMNHYRTLMPVSGCIAFLYNLNAISPLPKVIVPQLKELLLKNASNISDRSALNTFLDASWPKIVEKYNPQPMYFAKMMSVLDRSFENPLTSRLDWQTALSLRMALQITHNGLNTNSQKAQASFYDLVSNPTEAPIQTIFSFLSKTARSTAMKTCKALNEAGKLYIRTSKETGLEFLFPIIHSGPWFSQKIVPSYLHDNIYIGLFTLKQNIENYRNLHPTLQQNPEIMRGVVLTCALQASEASKKLLEEISKTFQNSKDMKKRLENLQKVPFPKTKFWEVAAPWIFAGSAHLPQLIKCSGRFEEVFFPEHMHRDTEFRDILLHVFGSRLFEVHSFLTKEKDFFEKALAIDGIALQFGTQEQQSDKALVRVAVKQNGLALRFASEDLRKDPYIVNLAIQQNPLALGSASDEFRNDPEIAKFIIEKAPLGLCLCGPVIKNNKDLVALATKKNFLNFAEASEVLKNDREFVLSLITESPSIFFFISEDFKKDPEIAKHFQKQPDFLKIWFNS